MTDDVGRSFAEDIGKNAVELQVGNSQTILHTVLFTCGIACEFHIVTNKVTKLADVGGRNKTSRDKVMLEDVCYPSCIFLVCFLAADCLDILGVSQTILQSDSRML